MKSNSRLGMLHVEGDGYFTGTDIAIGEQFKEMLLNEGYCVSAEYGVDTMLLHFTTEPNTVFIG